jgi:hypothetical protein
MSPPVLDPDRLVRRPPHRRQRAQLAVAVLVGLAALVPLTAAMRAPATVDAITVVNDSPYDVHVDVRGPGPVLGLGTVPRARSTRFTTVLDQGDTWTFVFAAGGEAGGSVEVPRRALERDGWTLAVPRTVASTLERAGLPPSPATRTP